MTLRRNQASSMAYTLGRIPATLPALVILASCSRGSASQSQLWRLPTRRISRHPTARRRRKSLAPRMASTLALQARQLLPSLEATARDGGRPRFYRARRPFSRSKLSRRTAKAARLPSAESMEARLPLSAAGWLVLVKDVTW